MLISFFESFKYVGHLWPVALLRVYTGWFFLSAGIHKVEQQFLTSPVLQTTIEKWISNGAVVQHYAPFLQNLVLTHWQVFSYLVVTSEIAIGLCYIVGFMVRPAALVAIFLNLNILMAGGPEVAMINKIFIAISACLFLLAAGRCVGFDYYFFKKIRGFWW